MIEISSNYKIMSEEYEITYARSSGPGGQNVNKVNSKATLKWNILLNTSLTPEIIERFRTKYGSRINNLDQVVIQSDSSRDQKRNAEECKERLKEWLLEVLVPPKKRKPTKPSKRQVEKRLEEKKKASVKRQNRNWRPD